jgi:hypothetical protein
MTIAVGVTVGGRIGVAVGVEMPPDATAELAVAVGVGVGVKVASDTAVELAAAIVVGPGAGISSGRGRTTILTGFWVTVNDPLPSNRTLAVTV